MMLTKDGRIRSGDCYVVYEDDSLDQRDSPDRHSRGKEDQADGKRIIPLKALLNASGVSITSVWLDVDDNLEAIEPYLPNLEMIAVNFPTFNEGRGYSTANILRTRYAFTGEIRAIEDVRVDQLEQMVRCGFDTFELAEGQDPDLAARLLKGFTFSYQKTTDREPLFRQRGGLRG